jgi:hypothetical protein
VELGRAPARIAADVEKGSDVMRNVREAQAHIETTIALIDQASGPDFALYEGYSIGRARRLLHDAKKLVDEAATKLSSAIEQRKETRV